MEEIRNQKRLLFSKYCYFSFLSRISMNTAYLNNLSLWNTGRTVTFPHIHVTFFEENMSKHAEKQLNFSASWESLKHSI